MILNAIRRPKKEKEKRSQHVHKLSNREWQNQRGKAGNEKWSATFRGIFDSLFPWASPLPSEKTF